MGLDFDLDLPLPLPFPVPLPALLPFELVESFEDFEAADLNDTLEDADPLDFDEALLEALEVLDFFDLLQPTDCAFSFGFCLCGFFVGDRPRSAPLFIANPNAFKVAGSEYF